MVTKQSRSVPFKVTITPELHQALQEYARVYASTYGREEAVAELVPAMLAAFLDSDRAFSRAKSGGR